MLRVQLEFRNSWKEMVFYARVTISTLEGVKGSHIAIKVVNSSKADTHYLLFCHLEAKNCQLESDDWWSVSRFFGQKTDLYQSGANFSSVFCFVNSRICSIFFRSFAGYDCLKNALLAQSGMALEPKKIQKTQKATKGNRGGFSCFWSQASTSGVNLGIAVWLGAKDVVKNVSFWRVQVVQEMITECHEKF